VKLSPWKECLPQLRIRKDLAIGLTLLAVYILVGKLSLRLALIHPSASVVWPPTGIALAGLLVLGYRFWPAIFLGAFSVNITTFGSLATSLGIATGNTLEAVLGCWLVNRFAGGGAAFETPLSVFRFALHAAIVSTAVSATIGVASLSLGGYAAWSDFPAIWLTWWLGDACGALIVAPLLLLWAARPLPDWDGAKLFELVALFLFLAFAGAIVFAGVFHQESRNASLTYLFTPLLVWTGLRFNQRKAATAVLLLSTIAVVGTLRGYGPFVTDSSNKSLLQLHSFLAIVALMTLVFAAEVAERKRLAERFGLAVESAPNGMVMADRQGRIVLANSQAVKMFGYSPEELIGQSVEVLVPERYREKHPGYRMEFSGKPQARPMGGGRDLYAVRKDGSEFPVEIGLNPIHTDRGTFVLAAIVDISERKRAEEEIRRLASMDPLTDLANYRRLVEALDTEVKRFGRSGRPFSVLLLDLDGLKKINDEHGHLVGSRALCRVADVLRLHCREVDTPARYGGDEFAVVLPETSREAALQVARRISKRLAEEKEMPRLSVSVGAAVYPEDGATFEHLLGAADAALYQRKR